jgi:hypothetical protein
MPEIMKALFIAIVRNTFVLYICQGAAGRLPSYHDWAQRREQDCRSPKTIPADNRCPTRHPQPKRKELTRIPFEESPQPLEDNADDILYNPLPGLKTVLLISACRKTYTGNQLLTTVNRRTKHSEKRRKAFRPLVPLGFGAIKISKKKRRQRICDAKCCNKAGMIRTLVYEFFFRNSNKQPKDWT